VLDVSQSTPMSTLELLLQSIAAADVLPAGADDMLDSDFNDPLKSN